MIEPALAEVLVLARQLAREAGAIQREGYEQAHDIGTKSADVDLVTEVDHACEAHVLAELARRRPGDAVLAEEGGGRGDARAEWRWLVDPLDGTVNYAHGYPCFCVSIGVERRGTRAVGVVYDPLRDELFHAVRGGGAFRNDRPIRVSREAELGRGLFATGFAYDVHTSADDNLAAFGAFVKSARAVRRDGSAALDLCYVACGRFDGYWERKLKPWDVCAGALVLEEAGGRVSDLAGEPMPADGREVVASNGSLHAAMLALLARAR
ncbi:MAG TPA: inositol monophosphatase family protein [Myxococcota bacterium]|nr:inositol monophosphatase family protein [Myxococcota bacterium]